MSDIIEINSLCRRFGTKEAVQPLSFGVPEGSVFAFLGPNGAGKTTTIKMLMNILEPTSGSARVLGQDSRKLGSTQFRKIGYVSENQEMPDWMTVEEFMAYCRPFYPDWDRGFEEKLSKQFDLPAGRPLKQLSRGMKAKAALLSSLAYHPQLLMLDEPFSGLDPLVRDEFIRGMLERSEEGRWTVFLSSHDIDEVERLADWVGVVNDGALMFAEPVAKLQARFRRVTVNLPSDSSPLPDFPKEWLDRQQSGHSISFVNSAHEESLGERPVRERFPTALSVQLENLTLREIFLSLARSFRLGETNVPPVLKGVQS